MRKLAVLAALPALIATPVSAQTTIDRAVDAVARAVGEATRATDRFEGAIDQGRFTEPQRYAIDRCRPTVEAYGRARYEAVEPSRRGWTVYGSVYNGSSYNSYRGRGGTSDRSFKCDVREDGRVKVKTKRLRYS